VDVGWLLKGPEGSYPFAGGNPTIIEVINHQSFGKAETHFGYLVVEFSDPNNLGLDFGQCAAFADHRLSFFEIHASNKNDTASPETFVFAESHALAHGFGTLVLIINRYNLVGFGRISKVFSFVVIAH